MIRRTGALRWVRTRLEFLRIEHTLFSLPLAYAGALLAEPPLTPRVGLLILVAATGARTFALATNRIVDRRLDARNPRTASRALPSGAMSVPEAVAIALVAALVFLVAAYAISPLCLPWAPLPLAVFVGYPFLKRFTRWAHLGVGVGLAMAPLGAFFAVSLAWTNPAPVLFLAGFTLLWAAGFDIVYATQDEASDRVQNVRSLPAAIGSEAACRVAIGLHGGAFLLLLGLYAFGLGGLASALLLGFVGCLLAYEHRIRHDIQRAFFHVNALAGAVVLLAILASPR